MSVSSHTRPSFANKLVFVFVCLFLFLFFVVVFFFVLFEAKGPVIYGQHFRANCQATMLRYKL